MKRLSLLLLFLSAFLLVKAEEEVRIELSGATRIQAGDPWELLVLVEGVEVETIARADMFNGIRNFHEDLHLGTGGIARWEFARGELRQAGTSLVIITVADSSASFSLEIFPRELATLQSFTSSNSIRAYGEGRTSLIAFAYDDYGNPVDDVPLNLRISSPSGEDENYSVHSQNGLVVQEFNSLGQPGLMRISLNFGTIVDNRTLLQTAGAAQSLKLELNPPCVLADGIDEIRLIAIAADAAGNPVVNGTVVHFRWKTGAGTGILIDGQASLRIPAPQEVANIHFTAQVDEVFAEANLRVRQSRCDD
jgi:hypothetical protein